MKKVSTYTFWELKMTQKDGSPRGDPIWGFYHQTIFDGWRASHGFQQDSETSYQKTDYDDHGVFAGVTRLIVWEYDEWKTRAPSMAVNHYIALTH